MVLNLKLCYPVLIIAEIKNVKLKTNKNTYHSIKITQTWLTFICIILNISFGYTTNMIQIGTTSDWKKTLITELEILPDEKNSYTLQQILIDSNINFIENKAIRPKGLNYWAKIKLVNHAIQDEYLNFETGYWDFASLFMISSSGKVDTLFIGIRDQPYKSIYLLHKDESVLIIANYKGSGRFRLENNINLMVSKSIDEFKSKDFSFYIDGIIFGILLGLTIYNLFLYISLRDIVYFWYTIYLFIIGLGFISFFQNSPSHLSLYFLPNHTHLSYYLKKIADNFNSILLVLFLRKFINLSIKYSNYDKFLISLIFLQLAQSMFSYFDWITLSNASRIYMGSFIRYSCLGIALYDYYQGNKKAIVFLIGLVIVCIGDLNAILAYKHIDIFWYLPHTPLVNYFRGPVTFFFCGALEAIVFSFALAGKYNGLQHDINRVRFEKEQDKQTMLAAQNETLEHQVKTRTDELTKSISNLKSTQAQLIQSEKMASLGELTSGIAHEIQNPLNFITNFSELNLDILSEIEGAPSNAVIEESSFKNLKKNSEKIHHHGKRIDGIVRGMLQHSRGSHATKELSDINTLCDESLRLAFHAFRAKDKAFNSKYEMFFDPLVPNIKVDPQELSRVLLNIITNAFYTVNAKSKKKPTIENNTPDTIYHPLIKVSTKSNSHEVSIFISDNGEGIPEINLSKIFQPFYTTKPTGEGTGLGLSLAYDIITKGHSGELKVKSKEGVGTDFEIILPIQ